MIKKFLSFALICLMLCVAFSLYSSKEVYAIPYESYPTTCIHIAITSNGKPLPVSDGAVEVYKGDVLSLKTLHAREPEYFDQTLYRLDEEIIDIIHGSNIGSHTLEKMGDFTLSAEIEGYSFFYYGNMYDNEGNNLGGAGFDGTGGPRYVFDDIKTSCSENIRVLDKPDIQPTTISVTNATTGGTFEGDGAKTNPYLIPNRTNTRFIAELLGGESITAWLINGNRVNSSSTRLDYTLWRTGDWIFGPEVRSGDGSLRQEEVFIRSL